MKKAIPNSLTLLRLLLTVPIIVLGAQAKLEAALALFIAAALTDALDGYLARRWNAVSGLGAILDPICDRIFTLALFSALMAHGACPRWFLALLITVNIFLLLGASVLRLWPARRPPLTPARLSKWNTLLQMAWIGLVLLDGCGRKALPGKHLTGVMFPAHLILGALQIATLFTYWQRYHHRFLPQLRSLLPAPTAGAKT